MVHPVRGPATLIAPWVIYQAQDIHPIVKGDFEADAMLDRLRELYAGYPAGPAPARLNLVEPPLQSETRVEVQGPGEMVYLQVAYHAPQATHPHFLPLAALDSLSAGHPI